MGKRALLAQGLEAVYSNSNEFIPYHEALEHAFMAGTDASKPKSFCKAMQRPDANLWYKAAVKEMQAHIENGTWELVKLPPGCWTCVSWAASSQLWRFTCMCD
jgi:hypothetical protein